MKRYSYGVRTRPYYGELVCGDGFVIDEHESGLFIVLIDSLGHGHNAANLSRQMEKYLYQLNSHDLVWVVQNLHDNFFGSIGAAVTLFSIDTQCHHFTCINIGNNSVRYFSETQVRMDPQPGVIGERIPTLQQKSDSYNNGDMFILSTDGISSSFSLSEYPTLQYQTADQVADFIMEKFSKRHDDATVIVVRCGDG